MTANLYKVLFEVQVLHEYYLTDPDQSSVFDAANIGNAAGYLATRQQQGRPSITNNVQFVLPETTQALFRNYSLRLINTYSGFQVVGKAPVTMPADLNLLFLLSSADGSFGSITNGRMQREIGGLYYFNNGTLGGPAAAGGNGASGAAKTFPVLSNPIPGEITDGSYPYQQGELAKDNGAVEFAYYATGNTAAKFGSVSGDGFANEGDRMLVATRFNFTFSPTDKVTSASFVLKDVSGNTIKTINTTAATPLDVVLLDLSQDAQGNPLPLQTLPDARLSDPILYTLTVTGNAGGTGSGNAGGAGPVSAQGYSKTFNLVFYDDDAEFSGAWGAIQLQTTVGNAAYSLLDANGGLTSPVFQIRFKSLPTFRLYVNNTGQALGLSSGLSNILVVNGDNLASLAPVPLTLMPYYFVPNQWAASGVAPPAAGPPAGGNAPAAQPAAGPGAAPAKGTVYLPAPDPGGSMDLSNNQLSSLILVPVSPLFPLAQAPQ